MNPNLKFPNVLLHGCDYNPEQWLDRPDILKKDIELMKKSNMNCMSVGIFSWSMLEPSEGNYQFEWLDQVIETLYANGISTVLATPSGAKPVWMAKAHPEILRVESNRVRNLQGGRHNHCYTSPYYRKKVTEMNTKLAKRYGNHPAVILWHISNEIQGECHCPLCQKAFREYLKKKFGTLENLNHAYWTHFWSHTYTDWDQIESPAPHGETNIHGLNLDWKRFCAEQTLDFFRTEIAPIKAVNPQIPVTANLMTWFDGLNYHTLSKALDVVSWDSYPAWHNDDGNEYYTALWTGAYGSYMHGLLQKPFYLMENTPSTTNWWNISRLKRPKMHKLSAVQTLSLGANSIQYFQWRQSRGSCEKFHSAVVDHRGTEGSRVFRDVSKVGALLKKLSALTHTDVHCPVGIFYDIETYWAINDSKGPRNEGMPYNDLIVLCYETLSRMGVQSELIPYDADLSSYKVLVVPLAYQLRGDFATRLLQFAQNGGTVITSFFSGRTDENDLCYLGEVPHGDLGVLTGVSVLETDAYYEHQENEIKWGRETYDVTDLCEIIHPTTAKTLATYTKEFYAETPALTRNDVGKGECYYVAGYVNDCGLYGKLSFWERLFGEACKKQNIKPLLTDDVPKGVITAMREGEGERYYFVMNFTTEEQMLELPFALEDVETGEIVSGSLNLEGYDARIFRK